MPTETPYKNRELDEKFGNLLEHMKGFESTVNETLERIERQTVKTNGRVGKLENFKWLLFGMWIILTLIILPLVAAFISAGKI